MNKNKYIWNWTVVAKLAPEYEKYLEEDIDCLNNNYIRPIRNEGAVDTHNSLRTKDLDDAEMDILNMMIDKNDNDSPTNKEFNDTLTTQDEQEETEPKLRLKPEYEYPETSRGWYVPTTTALPPPKTALDIGSEVWIGEDTLYFFRYTKPERGNKNQIFLLYKYKYSHFSPFIRLMKSSYRFDPLNNTMSEIKKEFRGLTYNYETGNAYIIKNVNKTKNKQYHKHLQGILFNLHLVRTTLSIPIDLTEGIQLRNKFLKKMEEEVRKNVPDLFVLGPPENTPQLSIKSKKAGLSIIIPQQHLKQISIHEQESLRFLLTLLQGKLKKRFQPPNIEFIKNLYSCFEFEHIVQEEDPVSDMQLIEKNSTIMAKTAKYKKNLTRRILRALKKPNTKNLSKIFLKTRFKPYKNLYNKLFKETPRATIIIKNIMYLEETEFNKLKHICHFLSYVLSLPNNKMVLRHIEELLYSISNIPSVNDDSLIVDTYLKTYKRFLIGNNTIDTQEEIQESSKRFLIDNIIDTQEEIQESLVNWARWKDIYSMGNQLGIRIRPNKFKNEEDVNNLHDKFAEYFQRDRKINRDYNGFEFLEFKSPNKEYIDSEGNKFKFIQIRTASKLVEEGIIMHHCVGSYAPQCAKGTSIIFSMNNGERSYVTIELKGNSLSYKLGSVYTIKDNVITNQSINEIINEWHENCLELHKEDTIPYSILSEKLIEKFRLIKQLELQNEYQAGEFGDRTEGLTKRLNELITEIQEIKKVGALATNEV